MMGGKVSTEAYGRFVLIVAGLGGLLYALLYLGKTISLTVAQTSVLVAAVLGGSMVSSLIAGLLADWMGRKRMMIASGLIFVASLCLIVASQGFAVLLAGRILQGMSGGVIAVTWQNRCVPNPGAKVPRSSSSWSLSASL